MDAIEDILDFGLGIQFEDIPPYVIDRTRLAFLDTLGTMVAGIRGEGVIQLSELVSEWAGAPQATLITSGQRVPMPTAALLNGVAARAWDLDDVHEQNTCHIFASVIPALFALAQGRPTVSGKEALTAAAIAGEVICRLSSAPRATFSETGSSMTYQCAQFGVTLMVARLLHLTKDAARNAMGITYARVCGNQQGFQAGAMTVRLMQGVSAETGILSALMAERGITGSAEILEGKFGYYPVYHHGRYERADIVRDLGKEWRIPEISIKPASPNCKFTHGPIAAAIEARAELGPFELDQIAGIDVTVTNREVYDVVCLPSDRKWAPQTLTDAQFSLPFAIAHAVANGKVDIGTFLPPGLEDERVRFLMPRVRIKTTFENQEGNRGTFPMPGIVAIHLVDGRHAEKHVAYVKGHPKNPMSFQDVAAKFLACANLGRPDWKGASMVIDGVGAISASPNVAAVMDLLTPSS